MTGRSSNHPASTEFGKLNRLLEEHRERLKRMVAVRLDRRLAGRVDASDVVQEAFIDAALRYREYEANQSVPPFIWLRFLTGQKLSQIHRKQLGVKARDVNREISLYRGPIPEATSHALAAQLIGHNTSPTQAVLRAELKVRVQQALNDMSELDREILSLRHFEQVSNAEAAMLLELNEATCYKRYVRALKKIGVILGA